MSFLALCREYDLESVGIEQFENFFNEALQSLHILGHCFFETILEYVSLFQDDPQSKRLAEQGELNTYNYFKLVFDLSPQLYTKFRLERFKPKLTEVAAYLQDASNQGKIIESFSQDHFYDFMKWRIAQYIRRRVLGSGALPKPDAHLEEYLRLNPNLVGHIIHRDIRQRTDNQGYHINYEQIRASKLWSYWTEKKILFPYNALLPKGEIGINPKYENLKYRVHRASLDNEGRITLEEELGIKIVDKIIPSKLSVLRPGIESVSTA
ncbi:hypothetical protein COW99_00650 [Candidatus Roizmanbacteria bacterium CG22_combo_CG10-13_8_21_14_all_38_20]|uniref:Uncharacterized protein n=1 Tax=Candidatus Roizmanbacteria bacterium CG22_combo_CG10-13_8_21_14_all_38_20 TaxID=1974862 RepID=A0A2H0BXC0_9BACT|nr:hypothetical protein [Candidatus Microgenomates bacterium]PIP62179.1 MAG: hypothetical protein COW99_00650 [Candidatus Roizmanbacteria bacterium CG22_combo_CG10-13_8_21_14_all_38_20]PJC30883.1 MAG: hypothetical protein CO050_04935 [Candidatus Roizmanbacteria bacterium CG_4_9_14_0_2_um_filter_38_17]